MDISKILELSDRYEAYMLLSKFYQNSSCDKRKEIISKWDFNCKWIFPEPHKLACKRKQRFTCDERIIASLLYYSFNEKIIDEYYRENIVGLAIEYHSCIYAGIEPYEMFVKVARISSDKASKFLMDFIDRTEEDKSLEAFALKPKKNWWGEIEIKYPTFF